ncbi:MAG: non-canonical purine NTP pyrophosphatase [Candidatus Liptonbacteria bacterium]|nr:non-canonical purine NTP pyrophosphatase [Candidatus Liptonbacteria bacterium]
MVHFATTNQGKAKTLKEVLGKHGIRLIHHNIELTEQRGESLRAIATNKVLEAYERIEKQVLAQDSGFYLAAWNGWPGTQVNPVLRDLGLEGILKLVHGKSRECEFRSCLAYYDGKDDLEIFESVTKGTLAESPRGENENNAWSVLFRIFVPAGHTKTLAEMTPAEFKAWQDSRSADSATAKFVRWFKQK